MKFYSLILPRIETESAKHDCCRSIRSVCVAGTHARLPIVAAVFVFVVAGVASDRLAAQERVSSKPVTVLKYGDGKSDGKKSIAGSGEMIRFQLPDKKQKLRGIRIHGARYGQPKAPDQDVEISVVDQPNTNVVHTEMVPYKKFKRGGDRWMTITFEDPVEVPEEFWVILDFDAQRTQGVYVSFDTSTKGEYSKVGLPGGKVIDVATGGDWMVQSLLTRPE